MHVQVGENYTLNGLLGFVLLIAFFIQVYSRKVNLKSFPFLKGYFLVFLSFLFAGFELRIGVVGSLLSMFILPLAFWLSKDKIENWISFVVNNLCVLSIPIVIIGLIELILGYNLVGLWLEANGIMSFAEMSEDYMRFGMIRCHSLVAWCSTYGVLCGYTLITLLFAIFVFILFSRSRE